MSASCHCGVQTVHNDYDGTPFRDVDERWHSDKRCDYETCPFCHDGYWKNTGTQGRLACSNCGSHALDGRERVAMPITGG